MEQLTDIEIAAHAKGYGNRFYPYVDVVEPIRIPASLYAQLVAWCEPFMARRFEVQGAVAFHYEVAALTIERAYVMGGKSEAFRTTVTLDGDDMLRQMQQHYPDRKQFLTTEVGFWHLHPGYFNMLSVGDVEECRQGMRQCEASLETRVLQLLMYGDGRGYQLTGYLVGLEEVNRLPVRIVEDPTPEDSTQAEVQECNR